jgi:uncharacterized protein (TIGR04255 family)
MTSKQLPTKLGKEPLIDVVCGVSFDSEYPVETILPGLLLSKLTDKQPRFETLPVAQLPQMVRDSDPNLQNAPLMRIVIDEKFTILIGSKWLGVCCQMPYSGWSSFKEMIQMVFEVLGDVPSLKSVDRHSLKYVDFIKTDSGIESLTKFNLKIEVAGRELTNQATQLRTEMIDGAFVHAVTILSPANAVQPDGNSITGALIDVDTHRIEKFTLNDFLSQLSSLLDEIHLSNKAFFFNLLSDAGLEELEPKYA